MNVRTLQTTGMVTLAYPDQARDAVLDGNEAWRKFCVLPEAEKLVLSYNEGVGYELKKTAGATLDQKEDFHFSPNGETWLRSRLDELSHNGREHAETFLNSAEAIIDLTDPLIQEFARQCEKELGLEGFADEVEFSKPHRLVRFLHYFGDRQVGEETATAHADKSGFTLHLYESDAGLQCLALDNRQWQDMPVSEGETVLIPGMQTQLRSGSKIRALCHRVIANEHTARYGRTSMVLFVPLKKTNAYNKAGVGRLQTLEPGFNYDMPNDKFSELFVPQA